jgi:hypothetical protein
MADKFSVVPIKRCGHLPQAESDSANQQPSAFLHELGHLGEVAVRRCMCLAAISLLIPDAVNDGLTFGRNHLLRTQQASDKVAAISGNLFAPLSLVSITVTLHLLDFYKRLIKP